MRKLPDVLRDNDFKVKCVLRTTPDDMFVYDVFGIDEDVVVGGLAIDIGTTTVSAVLIDMESGEVLAKGSAGNGQIRYGADVINRIIESQKPGGQKRLQDAVIKETINPMIHEMCKKRRHLCKPDIQNVHRRKYDNESSVCRDQCGSSPHGALYSCIL